MIKQEEKVKEIERKLEELYLDKLNRIIEEDTYTKLAIRFMEEKQKIKEEIGNIQ